MKLVNFMILVLSLNIVIAASATVIPMPFSHESEMTDPSHYAYVANTTPASEGTTLDSGYGVSLIQTMSWKEKLELALFGFPALIRQAWGTEYVGVAILSYGLEGVLALLYLILGIELARGGRIFG